MRKAQIPLKCPILKQAHQQVPLKNPDEEEGNQALLGPEGRTRGRERSPDGHRSIWSQVKRIVIETSPTLLFTVIGLLFTGQLLNSVSHWQAMSRVNELIMIVPVVLNLKGNLEMNLSARLGTAANMGALDKPKTRNKIILGNLTLLQVQATAVSFIAACVAFGLGRLMPRSAGTSSPAASFLAPNTTVFDNDETSDMLFVFATRAITHAGRPRPNITQTDPGGLTEFIMTASSAMSAACLSGFFLGSFMCTLVVLCRRFDLDPDNIAPPIASCLGDLITLSFLGGVSSIYIRLVKTPVPLIMIFVLTAAAIGWIVLTRQNPHVRDLIFEGWVPLAIAMILSCGTGIILDLFVSKYDGFALLAVVISGLPGSVGSIFVSRLSTALHAAAMPILTASTTSLPGSSPAPSIKDRPHPSPRLVMITLLLVTFPVELIFLATLRALGWLRLPILFVIFSVVFFCVAVFSSLVIAQVLTNFLWSKGYDPDMYALPIHSALMDLIGQGLLVVCFEIVSAIGPNMKTG
ncbi:SLC41A transporter family protein [Abortiporus biennis]